ncbi:hypothetical protein U9M48_011993 [Paspalum notatum var. saurae]|uniref:peptidylprolyl isomerase n=1 Tax=Paspalum notatum var. saurae TaxID=547442 RepID=A0AAQ3WHL7_PASNO
MELSLSVAPTLSPRRGALPALARRAARRPAFACRCSCSLDASPGGTRRWFASLLAAAAAVGAGVAGGEAGAVSTSRRALRASKIPESEFTSLPNGLKYYDIKVGSGAEAVKGSRVAVHYVAKWKGITFMTSRQGIGVGGGTPYGFDVGNSERGNVLKGLDLGVEGMKVGGQRLIIVPPELAYGKKGVQEIPPNATIELDVELLSIKQSAFGANRHSSCTDSSESSFQSNQSFGSICEEEEEEEMESTRRTSRKLARSEGACSTTGRLRINGLARQASNAEEITVVEATENSSEAAAKKKLEDDQRMATEEIASLKLMVSALEGRASSIESQFHEYCDMKEEESAYQKMQIMCLGMKLELLESQNQRLEAAAAEIRAAAEEFAAMKGRLERLQSKFSKIAKRSKQDSDAVGEKILALDAKQAQMGRRCEEFERCMEEMKQLTLQLQEQKGANNENVEVAVERSLRKLSSGRDLVDGLEALRDRWAAGMEEMIYLGWITAWLQHDLMLIDDDGGCTVLGDDSAYTSDDVVDEQDGGAAPRRPPPEEDDEKRKKQKGETMMAAVPPSNEVELCKAVSLSSSSSSGPGSRPGPRRSVELEPPPASCMGFAAAGGGGGWSIGRPRLLRRLRGWAAGGKGGHGGKGKARCRIAGPCCQK